MTENNPKQEKNPNKNNKDIEKQFRRSELEFLPAALEITESPPSPLGRALLWAVMLLFVIAIVWAVLGKVDEVAVAPGKIIPAGYTKVIQAEDKGIVSRILVENGSRVKKGDVLIELDTVNTEADLARLRKERYFYKIDLARLYAERDGTPFTPPKDVEMPEEIVNQRELMRTRGLDHEARIGVIRQQIMSTGAALENARKMQEKYSTLLPIVTEQRVKVERLTKMGGIGLFEFQNYLQREIEMRHNLLAQREEVTRNIHMIGQLEVEISKAESERASEIAGRIVEDRKQLQSIEEELVKAAEKNRLSRIKSPIDGTVQQLEIHTVGAILTPAQPLMLVVPGGASVKFEVWVENKDIGFIEKGQSAEIKVETFGFQKYGTLEGEVLSVATEAKEDERRGLIYQAILVSSRDYFDVQNRKVPLMAGMAVTGEIKLKEKRVIEYFLDPFKTYVSEGLREH